VASVRELKVGATIGDFVVDPTAAPIRLPLQQIRSPKTR
jgi:hypothetical protein